VGRLKMSSTATLQCLVARCTYKWPTTRAFRATLSLETNTARVSQMELGAEVHPTVVRCSDVTIFNTLDVMLHLIRRIGYTKLLRTNRKLDFHNNTYR